MGIGLLSRWPIETFRAVEMPSRYRTPAPVTLVATVAHPAGPLPVFAACLEWRTDHDEDRFAQAAALVELATGPATDGPMPVIVCGDLNAASDSPILAPLHEAFEDTWPAGGGAEDAVTLPSDHPQAPRDVPQIIDQRIDHIFVRPGDPTLTLTVDEVVLLGDPVDGLHPSDHKAVSAHLTWTTGQG